MDLSNDNVIHVKKGQVEYLQFRKLLEYKDIVTHAYTLGKNVNFRTAKANKEPLEKEIYKQNTQNYKDVCEKLGQNYINIVKCNQEHTKNVASVKEKVNKNEPDFNVEKYNSTDGLITNKKDKFMHGIGLKNIKDTVYKYNGEIKIEFDDDKFVIKFIFSLKN